MSLRARLEATIDRLVAALVADHEREGRTDRPMPGKPASSTAIAKYEKHLGRALPPSYRAFLTMHDGYRGLVWPGDMLAIRDVMPGGARDADISRWKATCDVSRGIVIAQLGEPNDYTYLDPDKPSRGTELTVVKYSASYTSEFADLVAYFEHVVSVAQVTLPPPRKPTRRASR
jgi:hypothetical protein